MTGGHSLALLLLSGSLAFQTGVPVLDLKLWNRGGVCSSGSLGQYGQFMSGSYLGDDGQPRTQVMESNVCHVEAINEDFTLCGLQDAEQGEGHG